MFKPTYLIRLDRKVFSQDQVVCLGSQLKSIINSLEKLIEPHVWFIADVDAISPIPEKLSINSPKLKKIGNDRSIINVCEHIDQFLSGIFIAIKRENQDFKCSELSVRTEDEQFRSLNLEGILIEIRAFDTSYFEVYSDNHNLMEVLSKIYKVSCHEL
ncbi:MAG: hypothetical protein JSS32_04870 [Verrucomicrobia bacterium]|nr:hypothetical protein [Verrucomicrobiota bacterium]